MLRLRFRAICLLPHYMDSSNTFDHYTTRRDLLRSFLEEYALLAQEHPEVAEQLSFDGFVQFSFAYFRLGRQAEGILGLQEEVTRLRNLLPLLSLSPD